MKNILTLLLLCLAYTIAIGQTSPNYNFTDSEGNDINLYADYLDQGKVVFIEFMFIGCPPCSAYLPYMNSLYTDFGSGTEDVEFFQISVLSGDDSADMQQYKEDNNIEFKMIGSDGGAAAIVTEFSNGNYGSFLGTPTFAIIDSKGMVLLTKPSGNQSTWNPILTEQINDAFAPDPIPTYTISGSILDTDGQIFNTASVAPIIHITGDTILSTKQNPFSFEGIEEGANIEISVEAEYPNPVNGVTTYDLVLISQQIVGISSLNLIQQIAADANCSGSLTTFDVISLRQLILYISAELSCSSFATISEASSNDPNTKLSNYSPTIEINNLQQDLTNQNILLFKKGDANQ